MMTIPTIWAPFTQEQVNGLNRWQESDEVHPFTCPSRKARNPRDGTETVLVATPAGWVCPEPKCDFTQSWAHAFMVLPEPPDSSAGA